ncbi:MAG: hypothetical protein K2W92_07525 [Alphaproteobacteria bacterium]|nr:hypothetical protein [Alphaproteobacteria bacterium]
MIKKFRLCLLISVLSLHSSPPSFAMDDDKEIVNRIKQRISISKDKIEKKIIKIRDLEILLQKLEVSPQQLNTLPRTVNPNNPKIEQQSLPQPDFTGMDQSFFSNQGVSPKSPRLSNQQEENLFKKNSPLILKGLQNAGFPDREICEMAGYGTGNVKQNMGYLEAHLNSPDDKEPKRKKVEALLRSLETKNLSVQDLLPKKSNLNNNNNNNRLPSDD